MTTFLQILMNPLLGVSPLAWESLVVPPAARDQLHVFRTGVNCVSAGAEMIEFEQALVRGDQNLSRYVEPLASRLVRLNREYPGDYEVAVGRLRSVFNRARVDSRDFSRFGEPRDVDIRGGETGTPIRLRQIRDVAFAAVATEGVGIEEKLLFGAEEMLSSMTLIGPQGRELLRFYPPPHMEEGALLYIGKQEDHKPVHISSALPAGVPLAMEIFVKGANGAGPHFTVRSRGKDDVALTPGDELPIGGGFKLRLNPAEVLSAEPTRLVEAVAEEEEPGQVSDRSPDSLRSPNSLAAQAIGFHFGRLSHLELRPGEEIVLGRDPLRGRGFIRDNFNHISREHIKISRDAEGNFWVEDLGSTNGTAVNGEWMEPHQNVRLLRADFVKLGHHGEAFIFDYWMEEEPRRTTSTPPSLPAPKPQPRATEPRRILTPIPMPTVPPTYVWVSMAVAPGDSNPLVPFTWLVRLWEGLRRRLSF